MMVAETRGYKVDWGRLGLYAILLLIAFIYLTPLLVMVLTSFKSLAEIKTGNLLSLPESIVWDAWFKAWSQACSGVKCEGVQGYFFNSVTMVIPAVLLSTVIGSINGYIITKWRFYGSDLFFTLLLLGCFIPFQVILLPMAQTLGQLGISGTVHGLVLVHGVYGVAFTTLFFRNYYQSIPMALIQAARIDGAGFFMIYRRILLPVSKPIFTVAIIWQFTQVWNDFLFGVAFAGADSQPVTVALNNLAKSSTGVKEYNVDMAAAIITSLPTLLVYVISGKYFVRGLTAGSVKG